MPKRWMCLTVLLAMLMAACAPQGSGVVTDVEPGTDPTDPTDTVAESPDGVSTPTGAPLGEGTNEAVAEATLDPTMEAFYQEFELPAKGDTLAPVVLYEFSDYT